MKLAKTSIVLLAIQLALVSSIAAKYLYQRATCPRVWTRTAAYDPNLVMRGRYLSVQLIVDGCHSTPPTTPTLVLWARCLRVHCAVEAAHSPLPPARHAISPRTADGTTRPNGF